MGINYYKLILSFLLTISFSITNSFISIAMAKDFENKTDAIVIKKPKEVITYDYGNKYIMAASDSKLNINKYWVVNIKPSIISENSWITNIKINGHPIDKPDIVVARSGMFLCSFSDNKTKIDATTYTDNATNGLFQRYTFQNLLNDPGIVELTFNITFDAGIPPNEATINNLKNYFIISDKNNKVSAIFGSNQIPSHYYLRNNELKVTFDIKTDTLSDFYIVLSGGWPSEKEKEIFKTIEKDWGKAYNEALSRSNWIDNLFTNDNTLYEQMFSACIDCALSNFKEDYSTKLEAFYAGVRYKQPARTYYRDSYWTVQPILPFFPELVKKQIIVLAKGVRDNGMTGSGVKFDGTPWWSYHYDSPSFFVMMLYDYIKWTNDTKILDEKLKVETANNGFGNSTTSRSVTVWDKAKITLDWLTKTDRNNDYLIQKPINPFGDWADEVARVNEVTYNNALYYKALDSMGYLAMIKKENELSKKYFDLSNKVKDAINKYLWDDDKGYYVDFITSTKRGKTIYKEDHFMEDTFLAPLYGIANNSQTFSIFNYATKWLESRNNQEQPYGDWGTLCVWPLYKATTFRRLSESDDPYRYHNGADWPYLDGINALTRMLYNDENWEYPLTRWWKESLKKGWLTPVEYYQPTYPNGGLRQAWSAMPAAAIVYGGFNFCPHLVEKPTLKVPPFGDTNITNIKYMGDTYNIFSKDQKLTIYKNGHKIERETIFK